MKIGTHRKLGSGISGSALDAALEPITYNGEVDVFGDLPPASAHSNEIYNVANGSGIWPFNNPGGLYVSDGTTWTREGNSSGTIQGQIDASVAALAAGAVATNTALIASKADDPHTHVKADITDFSDADYATAAQGALADTALQSETAETLAIVGTDLVFTGSDNTPQTLPLSLFGEDDTNLARITSASLGDFFTLTLLRDDSTQINVDLSNLATNVTNSSLDLDASNILTITDSNSNTVTTDLSSLDNTAAITALAVGAVAANAAALLLKADLNHTHVEADITDLDKYTQAEADALLANKSDVGHTHVEADITDLDKYTQAEVDALIEDQVVVDLGGPTLYVAPDAASALVGDFIGGTGIRDAVREASRYMVQNPTSFINIYLRDGEYTLIAPIEVAHPQGKKVIRIRPLTLQSLATNQAIDAALTPTFTDKVADDATLAANYDVIINCPSYGMFLDKGTGIETVDSIMFRYTGTSTTRAGVYAAQQGSATLSRCAFIGFPYGVRALEFASVGITTGGFFLYCNLTCLRAEEMSVIRVTQSANYKTSFHSITQYTIYALTKAYIRIVAASTSRIKLVNDSTNRANVLLTGMATVAATRCDLFGGDEGFSVQQNSFCQISTCTITGNESYAVFVTSSDATVTSLTADPLGDAIEQRVYALRGSKINETGTHTNVNFLPAIGSAADTSAID